jgi:methylated-DNA-[protein]-cysteine S-methyltransferase
MELYSGFITSPCGIIEIRANHNAVFSIQFVDTVTIANENVVISQSKQELHEYFNGKRTEFTMPIQYIKSIYSTKVYEACMQIPYGTTTTYKNIAYTISSPQSVRAIGNVLHNNPILIVIPCHRIVHVSHSKQGYKGGIWRKQLLLDLEKKYI